MVLSDEAVWDERFADVYDVLFSWYVPSTAQIAVLVEYARGSTALEIGAGTGRVTIPLARAGVAVDALDLSAEMLSHLGRKAAGLPIRCIHGDATEFAVSSKYQLVYAPFNLVALVGARERQRALFASMRAALSSTGTLVLENFVPHEGAVPGEQTLRLRSCSTDRVILETGRHIRGAQRCEFQYVVLEHGKPVVLLPHRMDYLWPAQLDALAESEGLRVVDRFSDWNRTPFTDDAPSYISIYSPTSV